MKNQIERLWSKEILVTGMILVFGLILRIYGFASFTSGVPTGDEIIESHIQPYLVLTHQATYNHWTTYSYFFLCDIWYRIFGFSLNAARFLSILLGELSILFAYLLTRELFNRRIATVGALFIALSAYHIHFSKLAIVNIHTCFFSLSFLYFYLKLLQNKNPLLAVFTGAWLAAGMFSYPGFLPLLPSLFFTWIMYLFSEKR